MKKFAATLLAAVVAALGSPQDASALIEGGTGNKPLRDPGWPKGAAAIFNHKGRVAYWVGPPFGGGQWHSECRGDVKAVNAVLADFAKIDSKVRRVVLHDGVGYSHWLAPNREKDKLAAAKIDWRFMVWQPSNWERLRSLPPDLNPTGGKETSPPAVLDIYMANFKFSDLVIPRGLEFVDNRLEGHGFTTADGIVFTGTAMDVADNVRLEATVKVQRIENKDGKYQYTTLTETKADPAGKWVIRKAPAGWVRVVVEAAGYAPRVVGYSKSENEPRLQKFECRLAKAAEVAGRVVDDEGKPLPDVSVRLSNFAPAKGEGRYDLADESDLKTDAEGRFRIAGAPIGKASVWIHKSGYVRPGLGPTIEIPAKEVSLTMGKSSTLTITVDFTGKTRPGGYVVNIEPEGGSKVGTHGGSGNIDPEGKISFKDFPPGKYVITGRPNPGSEKETTKPLTVELKSGVDQSVTIHAK
jgi:hypothetical protein